MEKICYDGIKCSLTLTKEKGWLCLIERFKNKSVYGVFDHDLDGNTSLIVYKSIVEPHVKSSKVTSTGNREMEDFSFDYMNESDIIIFVDIAPTPSLYNKIKELNKEVFIFDHHETSFNILKDIVTENYYYSEVFCGAKVFFDALTKGKRYNKVLSQMVELCNVYDTWQKTSLLWKTAKDLNNVMFGYVNWATDKDNPKKFDRFIEEQLNKIKTGRFFYFTSYEEDKIKLAIKKEQDALRQARTCLKHRIDNQGNNYIYLEINSKISYVSNQLLEEMEKVKYVIGHSTYEDNNGIKPQISLRTINDRNIDVSKIAERWGGGGHPCSSGVLFKDLADFIRLQKGLIHLI